MSAEANGPILQARNVVKRFGRVTALDHADFDLRPNEILGVIGDNGAGKSTLIKILAGAITPDQGEVTMDGRPVHFRSPIEARHAGIETVYQNLALSPALSIADNLFLGRERRRAGCSASISVSSTARRCARRPASTSTRSASSPSRTSTSPSRRFPAASARASPSSAPPPSAVASSSWTSRPRRSASRNRGRCSS
jgi:ABC-type sugar transport system ATPase subunit